MIGLRPAQKVSLAQHVLDQLLEQIRTGAVRPGDRIPSEHELMKIMNVGRSSVREALRGLIALGLLETSPGRGATIVGGPSDPLGALASTRRSIESLQQTALLDLLEVRECLEAQAARLAAQRATT